MVSSSSTRCSKASDRSPRESSSTTSNSSLRRSSSSTTTRKRKLSSKAIGGLEGRHRQQRQADGSDDRQKRIDLIKAKRMKITEEVNLTSILIH